MTEQHPHADSWYAASAIGMADHPALDGDRDCDVCVIGAGITGCSTALHLAERGYDVTVLESHRVGWGASGRSGGQMIVGYACDMTALEKMIGAVDTRRLWEMSEQAIALVRERVARHAIDCDLTDGYLLAAVKRRHVDELESWRETMARKFDYRWPKFLGRDEIRTVVSSERYLAGLLDPNSGHLHPLNYTLGLARAAGEVGARIHEHSAVRSVAGGQGWTVRTDRGSVRCKHVVYCCNAHIDGLHHRLRSRIMPVGTYMVATEPLGAVRATELIRNNASVCDHNFVLDYFRRSSDHRLLFGGKVSYSRVPPANLGAAMRRRMLRVFPQLADVGVDYVWGGDVAITINRAPDIGRLDNGAFYAQGFSGQGIALTGFAGQVLAEAVAGTAERFDVFARIRHKPFPGGPMLRTPSLVLAMAWYRLRDLV